MFRCSKHVMLRFLMLVVSKTCNYASTNCTSVPCAFFANKCACIFGFRFDTNLFGEVLLEFILWLRQRVWEFWAAENERWCALLAHMRCRPWPIRLLACPWKTTGEMTTQQSPVSFLCLTVTQLHYIIASNDIVCGWSIGGHRHCQLAKEQRV